MTPTQSTTTVKGRAAEELAELFLIRQGLRPITRNYQRKTGEIDLIMRDNHTLVFIEVRLRRNRHCANGFESVTSTKQRRLIQTAQLYLLGLNPNDVPLCRFDVIAYNASVNSDPEWIKNAFEVSY